MGKTILPSGEEISVTPEEILRYVNPDGLRQLLRQERLRWNLKPNKNADYYDMDNSYKYTSELHNEGLYQRMEIRTFPDNGANGGYAGINIDSGQFGTVHNLDQWNEAISKESLSGINNRVTIGAMAKVKGKIGCGLDDNNEIVTETDNRSAMMVFDSYDGRAYLMSNDDLIYVNNETRSDDERIPNRAVARLIDIPTRMTQLKNDLDFVADPDYHHTDNNFTNSNKYILDNIDDRTFVYPEISRDESGRYIENYRVGLDGNYGYGESDGTNKFNSHPDIADDRRNEAISSYNANKKYSGVNNRDGYLPGIFRSLEELQRVDLVGQKMLPRTHRDSPGSRRAYNYYIHDGVWSPSWFDRYMYNDSYLAQSLNPNNMEIYMRGCEPSPYSDLSQTNKEKFDMTKLYQWRYNRVSLKYSSDNISIHIIEAGEQYKVGDILRWTFGDDTFLYEVKRVGVNGQIQKGSYKATKERIFEQNPSTHGVGIPFSNMSGVGRGAKLAVECSATIETNSTQIKNNLYAYVDITPTVRSDNTSEWSDINMPDDQDGKIGIRSTAAGPAYSGINSGRGGPEPSHNSSGIQFYEHGGNPTAGVHVHLFRYVINTQNPTWVVENGVQVFTGEWVDQGPLGLERPCDIKALLFSNPDCNNFNNYYKFMVDAFFDNMNRNPDSTSSNNPDAIAQAFIHVDQKDPEPDRKFYSISVGSSNDCKDTDITDKVIYVNAATGVMFMYNSSYKTDPKYGYGMREPGWFPIAGSISK